MNFWVGIIIVATIGAVVLWAIMRVIVVIKDLRRAEKAFLDDHKTDR